MWAKAHVRNDRPWKRLQHQINIALPSVFLLAMEQPNPCSSSFSKLHTTLTLPTYDGDLLTRRSYRKRFTMYMDNLSCVSDDKKVSYLVDSLMDHWLKIV